MTCVCRPLLAAVLQSEVVPQVRAWVRGGQLPPLFRTIVSERDDGLVVVLALVWQEEGVRLTFAHETAERRCPLSSHWHQHEQYDEDDEADEAVMTTIRLNLSRFDIAAGVRAPIALSFGLRARYPFLLQRLRLSLRGRRRRRDEALFFSRVAPPRCVGRFLHHYHHAAAAVAGPIATTNHGDDAYACAFYDDNDHDDDDAAGSSTPS